jgi:transcriptional regulator with XRE-family HTH domain
MERGPGEEHELAISEDWRGVMRRARAAHGLTQAQLGQRVGTSQNMISLIEAGAVGSSAFVLPICRELGIPPPMFFQDEEDRSWIQTGRVLRARDMEVFRRALAMVEAMASALGNDENGREH